MDILEQCDTTPSGWKMYLECVQEKNAREDNAAGEDNVPDDANRGE